MVDTRSNVGDDAHASGEAPAAVGDDAHVSGEAPAAAPAALAAPTASATSAPLSTLSSPVGPTVDVVQAAVIKASATEAVRQQHDCWDDSIKSTDGPVLKPRMGNNEEWDAYFVNEITKRLCLAVLKSTRPLATL